RRPGRNSVGPFKNGKPPTQNGKKQQILTTKTNQKTARRKTQGCLTFKCRGGTKRREKREPESPEKDFAGYQADADWRR
ncbi:hypothetical protein, partial [Roseibium sp.]|uniref:hypothetical protein n=1 Tax=Roseibium sp. TaxID=1936156 RepID=UPI0032631546